MSGENIGLSLCEAVEIIVDNVVRDLKFDQTIKCTIVDASESDSGKYIVKDGSSRLMTAYSTEKYLKNAQVYVTIPKGDYEGTKIITGKAVTNADEPFIYNSPFDTYIDVTGNLVKQAQKYGLRTNSVTKSINVLNHQVTNGLKGFTRMGVSADFAAWLFEQECITGNYGVQLDILYTKGEHKNTSAELAEVFKSTVYLDISDMVGNPYHFESFYHQEKVFDIADMDQIISISAHFFQDANFYDRYGKPIPHLIEGADDDLNPLLGGELQLNLFMQNLHVSLGYGEEEVGDEFAQISTSSSLTYSATAPDNKKTMSLKWLRKNDMKQLYNIDSPDSLHEVRWYQYDITADTDGYGGVRWRSLGTNAMDCTFNPSTTNASEQIKAVAIYGKIEYEPASITADDLKNNYKQYYTYDPSSGKYTQCSSSSTFSSTTQYYLKVGNKTAKTSNILTFSNEQEVASQATMKSLSALTLYCYDEAQDDSGTWIESHGNYFYYGDSGALIDPAQANIRRKIVYEFTPIDGTKFNPDKVDDVVWEYPKKLEEYTLVKGLTATEYNKNPTKYYIDGPDGTHTKCTSDMAFDKSKSYYTCKSFSENTMIRNFRTETDSDTGKIDGYFNISSYLSSSYNNNTISLTLVYENVEYYATLDLTFGQSSLMGIGYNIDLQFADSVNALLVNGEKNIQYRARLKLYDASGIEQSLNGLTITVDSTPANDTSQPYGYSYDNGEIIFTSTGNAIGNSTKPLIIKVDVKGLSNSSANATYTISKYFPIAFKTSSSLQYLVGPTEIKYAIDGTLTGMARQPYQLFTKGSKSVSRYTGGITWTIQACHYDGKSANPSYLASPSNNTPLVMPVSVTSEGMLKPYPMWEEVYDNRQTFYALKGTCTAGNMVWWQPLPISKVAHFSSVIDNWESGTIKTEDGTILAPRLGAGTKDSDNKFSGVILGDWEGKMSTGSSVHGLGLYGFSHGDATFGFNQNGTAFIGGSSTGRILFDGTTSTIKSHSYTEGLSGMELNLTDGTISAYDFKLYAKNKDDSTKYVQLTTDRSAKPLTIGSKFSVDWDGTLFAQGGEFSGKVIATEGEFTGKVTAKTGAIGGWEISGTKLKYKTGTIYLDGGAESNTDIVINVNDSFKVAKDGSVTIGKGNVTDSLKTLQDNIDAATTIANTAVTTANGAVITAGEALADALEAMNTANGAVSTANSAVTTANGAVATAANALTNSNTALSTANIASTAASAAQTLANSANSTASAASAAAALAAGMLNDLGVETAQTVYGKETYLTGTSIYSPAIIGGSITGCTFNITGVGNGSTSSSFLFIYSPKNSLTGWLGYDNTGKSTADSNKDRVWLRSQSVLKLSSAGNISLEADVPSSAQVYANCIINANGGLQLGSSHYGSSLPGSGREGQLFFKI